MGGLGLGGKTLRDAGTATGASTSAGCDGRADVGGDAGGVNSAQDRKGEVPSRDGEWAS